MAFGHLELSFGYVSRREQVLNSQALLRVLSCWSEDLQFKRGFHVATYPSFVSSIAFWCLHMTRMKAFSSPDVEAKVGMDVTSVSIDPYYDVLWAVSAELAM